MGALVRVSIRLRMKFELHSFTRSKDMTSPQIFKWVGVP